MKSSRQSILFSCFVSFGIKAWFNLCASILVSGFLLSIYLLEFVTPGTLIKRNKLSEFSINLFILRLFWSILSMFYLNGFILFYFFLGSTLYVKKLYGLALLPFLVGFNWFFFLETEVAKRKKKQFSLQCLYLYINITCYCATEF